MTYFYLRQFPVLPPDDFELPAPWTEGAVGDWIIPRVAQLVATATDLAQFAVSLGVQGAPFVWDASERAACRAELDAAMFHLYEVRRDDVEYILETFPIVKRKDEKAFGEFRTKRLILEAYDRLAAEGTMPGARG